MYVSSWGGVKKSFSHILNRFITPTNQVLVAGKRLSYGDSCLNSDGQYYINTTNDLIINFDPENEVIKVESGISFEELLNFLVPRGFFLPVTPGTKFITVGGAIGNDIHGKNHHQDGNFGHWVQEFTLVRSNGEVYTCSKEQNPDLFFSTIGGLGLTGYIKDVTFKIVPIKSGQLDTETIKFYSLDEFLKINEDSVDFKYTVAWIDCFASTPTGRMKGLYMRGNHAPDGELKVHRPASWKMIPFNFPSWTLNKLTIKIFNFLYFNKQLGKVSKKRVHYDPFFYPLDSIKLWNRIYGNKGLYQFQCVLPHQEARTALLKILEIINKSGQGSFLSVLKTFGKIPSLGLLSFPHEGITLALDFPNRGESTVNLLNELYKVVLENNGKIYPAKDILLSKEMVEKMYPQLNEFEIIKDPNFISDWWKRARGI